MRNRPFATYKGVTFLLCDTCIYLNMGKLPGDEGVICGDCWKQIEFLNGLKVADHE